MSGTPIITAAGAKGGTGKTTTVLSIACEAAARGLDVIAVDCDPQASATAWLHHATVVDPQSPLEAAPVIVSSWPNGGRLRLARGGRGMEGAGEDVVRRYLLRLAGEATLLCVDTVPALQPSVFAALSLADVVLVPLQAEFLAARGAAEMVAVVRALGGKAVTKAVLTKYRSHLRLTQQVEAALVESYPSLLCGARSPLDIRCAEAPASGRPVPLFAPSSRAARAYRTLADEVLALVRRGQEDAND